MTDHPQPLLKSIVCVPRHVILQGEPDLAGSWFRPVLAEQISLALLASHAALPVTPDRPCPLDRPVLDPGA
jgi:hypothetical protein